MLDSIEWITYLDCLFELLVCQYISQTMDRPNLSPFHDQTRTANKLDSPWFPRNLVTDKVMTVFDSKLEPNKSFLSIFSVFSV